LEWGFRGGRPEKNVGSQGTGVVIENVYVSSQVGKSQGTRREKERGRKEEDGTLGGGGLEKMQNE